MDWYGVKVLNRSVISGEPTRVDKYYDGEHMYYEESIRMVRAESFEQAEEKAEKLARQNNSTYTNIYGQNVSYEFFRVIDSFIMTDMEDGEEVFSGTFRISKGESEDALKERFEMLSDEKDMRVLRDKDF